MHLPSTHPFDTKQEAWGTLYIIATPIGNLEDITLRALNVLKQVDLVAAEDTRHTGKLLNHFSIKKNLFSLHDHNERDRLDALIARLKNAENVALVSDAGTPSVSDPGFRLVREAVRQGVAIVPIPGVSAAITALCASGLPTDTFTFMGFPPRKKGRRREWLNGLKQNRQTLIFYESPHRIISLIDDMIDAFGDRDAVLGREMTKLHEEFLRGPLSLIRATMEKREQVRGECTMVVVGHDDEPMDADSLDQEIRKRLATEQISPSSLARELAAVYPVKKREIYEKILLIKDTVSR